MTRFNRGLACLLLASGVASAQHDDVTFFVIGKHANFSQDANGRTTPVDFSFFSEIFLAGDGDAGAATLVLPTGETLDYRDMRDADGGDRDNLLLVSGDARFDSFEALQARYPDGDYVVSFDTPSGNVEQGVLAFRERPLPKPPAIRLRQAGVDGCIVAAPGRNLTVSWRPFAEGGPDPNGILDDLVFVILEDPDGVRVAHSGRPFEGRPYGTYATRNHTIDGAVLEPDTTYVLSVEHAILDDTTRFDGVPAFTTRAVTTKLELPVGPAEASRCVQADPGIDSSLTMFYYEDIGPAAHFYGDVLGLENTLDWEWVKFYATGPASSVGLVTEGPGGWHPVRDDNSVMLSLVTDDVRGWYERLKDTAPILKALSEGGPVKSFLMEDPGGYTVEFFEWGETPE